MPDTRFHEITLRLDTIQQLFALPDPDPFSESAVLVPGIEHIVDALKPKSIQLQTRTTIFLPGRNISEDLEHRIRRAIVRYCQRKVQHGKQESVSLRWKGLKALQSGLIFLAACLLLSTVFGVASLARQSTLRTHHAHGNRD